jgi:hypothetical protein
MTELAIAAFVAVLVFAATRISSLGDALGRAVRGEGRPETPPEPKPSRPPAPAPRAADPR